MTTQDPELADRAQQAMARLADMARREGGLTDLVFKVGLSPALLPAHTPPDIVSAWVRLQQAAKDLDLIERRLKLDEDH